MSTFHRSSKYEQVAVRLHPAQYAMPRSTDPSHASYVASIYSAIPLEKLRPLERTVPADQATLGDLPLRGQETVVVKWHRYREFMNAFMEGAKDPHHMADRLIETMSEGLFALLSGNAPIGTRPLRLWWSSDTPELEELPVELVALRSQRSAGFSFVRGTPPNGPQPATPVGERLRVAVIGADLAPDSVRDAVLGAKDIDPEALNGTPHEVLRDVADGGFDVLHAFADGCVTRAHQGQLRLGSQASEVEISPDELSAMLVGSRVRVVAFHPVRDPRLELDVPTVYRAFAAIGRARVALPSLVAPLGPGMDWEFPDYWRRFYRELARTLEIEEAVCLAGMHGRPGPIALFLRQEHAKTFVKEVVTRSREEPARLNALLQASQEMTRDLEKLLEQPGAPDSLRKVLDRHKAEQQQLLARVTPWISKGE